MHANVVCLMLFLMLFPVVVVLVGALASTNCTGVRTRGFRDVGWARLIARITFCDFAVERRCTGRSIGWQAWNARRQADGGMRFVCFVKRIMSYVNTGRETSRVIVID